MKKYFLVLLLSVLCCPLWGTGMQQAEQAYREGHFATALGAYENLLNDYPNDPFLYYNIGNCYFKMGSKGLAVANYYRAFRLAPRDKDIRHNLSLALADGAERLVPQGIPEILHIAFFWFTETELRGLLYIAWWSFCVAVGLWCFKHKYGKFVLAIGILLCAIAGWYTLRYQIARIPLAVVASPVAELRSGPGNNFPASANISQGHLLVLQDRRDDWQEVIVKSQGIEGWINATDIEKI